MKAKKAYKVFRMEIIKTILPTLFLIGGLTTCGAVDSALAGEFKWFLVHVAATAFCALALHWLFSSGAVKRVRRFEAKHNHEGALLK